MIRISIDGNPLDTLSGGIELSADIQSAITLGYTGRKAAVQAWASPQNARIFGDTDKILSRERFNAQNHVATISEEGCVLLQGTAVIRAVENRSNGTCYRIVITEHPPGWIAAAANTSLAQTGIPFETRADAAAIVQSWTWNEPIRMLPVKRDKKTAATLCAYDYHPFVRVKDLARQIFLQHGVQPLSAFFDSALFGSLCIAGKYDPGQRSDYASPDPVGFCAGRFSDIAATANAAGNVFTTQTLLNSVGNIADTADPEEVRNGTTVAGAYNHGNLFRLVGGRAACVASGELTASVRLCLEYITSYRIESRSALSGFTRVAAVDGTLHNLPADNPFTDCRNAIAPGKIYNAVIFDYSGQLSFLIRYDCITNPAADPKNLKSNDFKTKSIAAYSSRAYQVKVPPEGYGAVNPTLWYRYAGETEYRPYTGDWAMYESSVRETGTIRRSATVLTPEIRLAGNTPLYLDAITFGGAAQGDAFTLCKETRIELSVRQSQENQPAETIAPSAILDYDCSQLDLIRALAHAFNLRFLSDEYTRTVRIEPLDDLPSGTVIDWQDKLDHAQPVEMLDPAEGMASIHSLGYDRNHKWSARIDSRIAAEKEKFSKNPLFSISDPACGLYSGAPDAQVAAPGPDGGMVFVRYAGMAPLPAGQTWGWPAESGQYPLAASFFRGTADSGDEILRNGFSLAYEDRDGVAGLHKYHDGQIRSVNAARRLAAHLHLGPAEIEAAIHPRAATAVFLLRIDGETIPCRLETIENYRPATGQSTRCTLITIS